MILYHNYWDLITDTTHKGLNAQAIASLDNTYMLDKAIIPEGDTTIQIATVGNNHIEAIAIINHNYPSDEDLTLKIVSSGGATVKTNTSQPFDVPSNKAWQRNHIWILGEHGSNNAQKVVITTTIEFECARIFIAGKRDLEGLAEGWQLSIASSGDVRFNAANEPRIRMGRPRMNRTVEMLNPEIKTCKAPLDSDLLLSPYPSDDWLNFRSSVYGNSSSIQESKTIDGNTDVSFLIEGF